jgi:hypothetical protein
MKRLIYSIRVASALLGLVAAFACSRPVRAQDVDQGTFVLPFEVQWQGNTLPAGEYHFRLRSKVSGGILLIRDGRYRGKMMVTELTRDNFSGPSVLTVVSRNGKIYVSSLALDSIGAKLEYRVPSLKSEAGELREASVQIIPVQTAGS